MNGARVLEVARGNHGFLCADDVAVLAADDATRLVQLVVRCGGCRFVAAAQDVAFLIRAVEGAGDYVRDVSLPAGSVATPRVARFDERSHFKAVL